MNEPTTHICDNCGTEISESEAFYFDEQYLCEDCLDNETVVCRHCDTRIWNDDNAGSDSFPLCNHCYDYYYLCCEECGCIIHRDDAYYFDDDDDYAYCSECYHKLDNGAIHDYSYKPDPLFHGEGPRFFGVELEIDDGGKNRDHAEQILAAANSSSEQHIYIKSDGSLSDGMEIVTHPMSLKYHMAEFDWQSVVSTAILLGYVSHKTSTCGLHIHISRKAFGDTYEQQEDCISRILYFVEHHWEELLKFSRRSNSQMNHWAARYGYKANPKELLESAKESCRGRYACVNLTNSNTIEFRMFRGTLKYNTLIATLQLVDIICELALNCTDSEVQALSWTTFVERISNDEYPELITYLKERRLYVNEPVDYREDD